VPIAVPAHRKLTPGTESGPFYDRGLYDQPAINVSESQIFLLLNNLLDFGQL
jgi:hypothetical protein